MLLLIIPLLVQNMKQHAGLENRTFSFSDPCLCGGIIWIQSTRLSHRCDVIP
jgi:hypothetical protein